MRRNSGAAALLRLSLDEIEKEIARCQMRRDSCTAAPLRKKFDNRLRKLRAIKVKKNAMKVRQRSSLVAVDSRPNVSNAPRI
jgi:hypothetical protein